MPESTGMLLGKFLPPHLGHQYLVDFARDYCDKLTVLVCSIAREPIPGALRFDWMRRMFPDCNVVHIDAELPQDPSESDEFWALWRAAIREHLPEGPDFVFASEDYGEQLASELGARFVPVDISRELVPVSGTAVREAPMRNWRYLPAEVRPYFVRRVCVFGPESTGKTTLAARLAEHFDTVWAHEYARPLLDRAGGTCEFDDLERIVRGQAAAQAALARQANRVMFCDTDAVTTALWAEVLFGEVPVVVEEHAAAQSFDLYLLCDIDVPFVADPQRYFPDPGERRRFMERCRGALQTRGLPFVEVRGDWAERERSAIGAVEALLAM